MTRAPSLPPLALALHQTPAGGTWAPMGLGGRALRRILVSFLRRGYRFVRLDETGPSGPAPGTALLTVDDGYASTMDVVAPLARELGVPWCVFVLVSAVGGWNDWDLPGVARRERHLTEGEIRDLAAEGVGIGSHGMTHRDFTRLTDASLDEELRASRRWLEATTARPVDAIAYPWGRVDARVEGAARRAGYRLGFTLRASRAGDFSAFSLPRTGLYAPDRIPGLFRATVVAAPSQGLPLRDAARRAAGWLVARGLAASGRAHA